jgi:hypothetical protein
MESSMPRLAHAVVTTMFCTLAACGSSSISGPEELAGTYRLEREPVGYELAPGAPRLVQGSLVLRADGTAVRRFEYDSPLPEIGSSTIEEQATFTVHRDSVRFVIRQVASNLDYHWRVSAARDGATLRLRYPAPNSNAFVIESYRRD